MGIFISMKNLKPTPFLEAVHQISKILFSLFAISLFSTSFKIPGLFIAFALSGLLSLILTLTVLIKEDKNLFFGEASSIEKSRVLNYVRFMGIASLSLIFFVSIDTLMLGVFVEASYIGYYRVALSLVLTISALLSISGILLPVFTQINKKRLERGFQKTFRYVLMFSVPIFFGLLFVSKYLIYTIFGSEYLPATTTLYILAFLVITAPLIALYSMLFESKEKTKDLSKLIFTSLMINVFLNYFLIKNFLVIGQKYAIMGAALATLISRSFLLISLSFKTKTNFKIPIKNHSFFKFLTAGLVMSLFLALFNYFVDLNLFLGIIEIIIGAGIYFGILFIIKGIQKEDINLIRDLLKK